MGQKQIIEQKYDLILEGSISESKYFFFETDPKKKQKLAIIFGGFEKCEPDFEIKRKSYPYYVLEIPTKGNCLLEIENQKYELKKGSIGAFSPGLRHHYKCDKDNPMEHIFIAFAGSEAKHLFKKNSLNKGTVLRLAQPEQILYLAETILKKGLEKTAISQELCCSYLRTLLLEQRANPAISSKAESISANTYKNCRRYIDNNFSEIFFPSEVADHFKINTRYMSRLFKKHDNITPHEYIMRLKLNRAANLLLTSSEPIKKIAEAVGFADAYHFSRNFKKVHGLSPKNYRNKF